MSKSKIPIFKFFDRVDARFTVVVDFPTPPLPLATATIFLTLLNV